MKAVVTGGAGFIDSKIVDAPVPRGDEFVVDDFSSGENAANLVAGLTSRLGGERAVGHGPQRPGDVRDSLADISAARDAFGFAPLVSLSDGLGEYVEWARTEVAS